MVYAVALILPVSVTVTLTLREVSGQRPVQQRECGFGVTTGVQSLAPVEPGYWLSAKCEASFTCLHHLFICKSWDVNDHDPVVLSEPLSTSSKPSFVLRVPQPSSLAFLADSPLHFHLTVSLCLPVASAWPP